MFIDDTTIEEFIKEDVPYIDLTTLVLGIGAELGEIKFSARGDMVLSGIEEIKRIFNKFDIKTTYWLESGTLVSDGTLFLRGEGNAENLHMAWKVSLNIAEYCCGIATRTKVLVDKLSTINTQMGIVTTRKSFPGTKALSIKSIIAGGAIPHRLGLSESILIFKQHINFIGGFSKLALRLPALKRQACEKKIIVEVEAAEDALLMAKAGVDGLQFDKISSLELADIVQKVRRINKDVILIAAGGINAGNIEDYGRTDVDVIATSAPYFGKPADIKVVIDKK